MSTNIELSIITPIYNSERFVEQEILSVINQGYNNYELILIDDGSTDKSGDICKKYIGKNIRYIRTENKGAGHARNLGVDEAEGKWILFLDSDDLLLTGFLSEQLHDFLRECEINKIDIIYTPIMKNNLNLTDETAIFKPESKVVNFMPKLEFVSCIYYRETIKTQNIRFYEFRKQDVESAFRFMAFSAAKNVLCTENLIYYLQRINPSSNVHTWVIDNVCEVKGSIFYDLYNDWFEKDIKIASALYEVFIAQLKQLIIHNIKEGYPTQGNEQLKSLLLKFQSSNNRLRNMPLPSKVTRIVIGLKLFFGMFWLADKLIQAISMIKRINYDKMKIQNQKSLVQIEDNQIIMSRLDRVSKSFRIKWEALSKELCQ